MPRLRFADPDLDLAGDEEYDRLRRCLRRRGLGLRLIDDTERLMRLLLGDGERDTSERVVDRARLSPANSDSLLGLRFCLAGEVSVALLLLLLLVERARLRCGGDGLRE